MFYWTQGSFTRAGQKCTQKLKPSLTIPFGPSLPWLPGGPLAPCCPRGPGLPGAPCMPASPGSPRTKIVSPGGPGFPGSPMEKDFILVQTSKNNHVMLVGFFILL